MRAGRNLNLNDLHKKILARKVPGGPWGGAVGILGGEGNVEGGGLSALS